MEKGDPKQLAVLAVMAVGAIGFLATQLRGRALPATSSAPAVTAATSSSKPPLLLAALTSDPFSHRKLAVIDPSHPGLPMGGATSAKSPLPRSKNESALIGSLPLAGNLAPSSWGPLLPSTKGIAKAVEKASPPSIEGPAAPMEISLVAIAGASDTVAFLSVGGAESQPYRPNDRIHGGVRLLRVEDGGVVLSGPRGELTLDVGERKRI